MSRKYSTECIVLKSSVRRDYDKVCVFFSPHYGKFSAWVRGVRRVNSRRQGSLDTLNRIQAVFSESPTGVKTLAEVSVIDPYGSLKTTMSGISKALYIIELVHRFFYDEARDSESASEAYLLLTKSLASLNKFYSKYPEGVYTFVPVRIMNMFEVRLMKTLGYEMSLNSYLLNKLAITSEEMEYLNSLKLGSAKSALRTLREAYYGADTVIKKYIADIAAEKIYSKTLF